MYREVIAEPFVVRDGLRVLQCHSKGDRRFSPFCCYVTVNGKRDSIENHYQAAKIIEGRAGGGWRVAKGRKPEGWLICGRKFELNETLGGQFTVGIQFYIALWLKYLRTKPDLVEYAKGFDQFEDPFAGSFPFCQARVIEQAVAGGVESLRPLCAPLLSHLNGQS